MDQTSALRRATRAEQDIVVKASLSSSKLDMFFRSTKIFRSQLYVGCGWEVSSSIFTANFPQPVGLRGVQVFGFSNPLSVEWELKRMAKCKYFIEGMKALTDNPRNHLVNLQYWHYASFEDSYNKLYVVYDPWSSPLYEHLSGLKKTLPWSTRLHILAGFMACVVYFLELIELNVISKFSLSTKSIFLDKSYNLHFTDVSLMDEPGFVEATDGDNLKDTVLKIGNFIMDVLCGIRDGHLNNSNGCPRHPTEPEGPEWVQGLIDPRLNTDYHTGQAGSLLTLGFTCLDAKNPAIDIPSIWFVRDIITSTVDMETKLTRSQVQGLFPALLFLEYNGAIPYTFQEVRDITSNFSTSKRYGKYVGTLSNGEKVLVEQLHPSFASPREFIDQVQFLVQ
jgi:hypothetical protein